MKNLLTYIFLSISCTAFCQVLQENFDGTLIFKETDYHCRLSRNITDTLITYYMFEADDNIEVTQYAILDNEGLEFKYLPFELVKYSDSLFLKYHNPIINKFDSIYQYPLNSRDTILACDDYKLIIDTSFTLGQDLETIIDTNVSICGSLRYEYSYIGDTLFNFDNNQIKCYKLQQYNKTRDGNKYKKIILISCENLIPVYEVSYFYLNYTRMKNIKRNQWILSKEMKLINIEK